MIEAGWGRDDTVIFRRIFADLLMPDASEEERQWLAEVRSFIGSCEEKA